VVMMGAEQGSRTSFHPSTRGPPRPRLEGMESDGERLAEPPRDPAAHHGAAVGSWSTAIG
jgi:hypothetical protein